MRCLNFWPLNGPPQLCCKPDVRKKSILPRLLSPRSLFAMCLIMLECTSSKVYERGWSKSDTQV
jgi:hypothetical protein